MLNEDFQKVTIQEISEFLNAFDFSDVVLMNWNELTSEIIISKCYSIRVNIRSKLIHLYYYLEPNRMLKKELRRDYEIPETLFEFLKLKLL